MMFDEFPTSKDIKFLQWVIAGAEIFPTCAKRRHMAIVSAANGRFLGAGYNGSPPGIVHCVDGGCPRMQEGSAPGTSYDNCIAIHAEENALMWSDRSMREGGSITVTGPPCWQCGKSIAGSGIKRVVYVEDPDYADWPRVQQLLEAAGVTCIGVPLEDL